MNAQKELLAIEKGFWNGDADYYRRNLDDSCLVAFTEMAGTFDKEQIAGSIKGTDRWRDLRIDVQGVLDSIPDLAIITYRAHATRKSGEPYEALVTSGYVARDGGWKMLLHQQTPLES